MKIARYSSANGEPRFGLVVKERVLPFSALARAAGTGIGRLSSVDAYIDGLPGSEDEARRLREFALARGGERFESAPLAEIRLLPPLDPPAMLDFGLSPRHLENSSRTLLRRGFGAPLAAVIGPFVRSRIRKMAASNALPYYKCNHLAIIGDGDETGWPSYSSYIDIEPELAFVAGPHEYPIAGYLIFNDVSARDVQMPEMTGTGPARSKDFARSKGLGPFLVTPDEVVDPLALGVSVRVGEYIPASSREITNSREFADSRERAGTRERADAREHAGTHERANIREHVDARDRLVWSGTTAEYSRHPTEVVSYLRTIFAPAPGTVIGMGTIPGCTGLDNDEWLLPGDAVEIEFEALGILRQRLPARIGPLEPSPWGEREELEGWYGAKARR